MQQLVETVLSVGARLAEVDHAGQIVQQFPLEIDSLTVTLHVELLHVRDELA